MPVITAAAIDPVAVDPDIIGARGYGALVIHV
jgi:hypothetical protein